MFKNDRKMTFRRFLTADYARDYVYVDEPREDKLDRAAAFIRDADYTEVETMPKKSLKYCRSNSLPMNLSA